MTFLSFVPVPPKGLCLFAWRTLIVACCAGLYALPASADDVPVAPLTTEPALNYAESYVLENEYLKLIVVPEIGRVAFLSYRNSPNLLARRELPRTAGKWSDLGGAWVWPVGQDRWTDLQEKEGPPPEGFGGTPWQSRGWENADGTKNVLLVREYDDPLNIKVTCQIKLHADESAVHFNQRMDRFDAGAHPTTLWNVVQVGNPDAAYFPISTEGPFEGGYLVKKGQAHSNAVEACKGALRVEVKNCAGELMLGNGPQSPWCAVIAQGHLLHFSTPPMDPEGTYPDDGCSTQLRVAGDHSFAELELLSEEQNLGPGESIEQSFILQVAPAKNCQDKCDPAQWAP